MSRGSAGEYQTDEQAGVTRLHLEKDMATHSSFLAWRNPMDRGAWQAMVHGVAESWTGLKCLSMHA